MKYFITLLALMSSLAFGQSHNQINLTRSSLSNSLYSEQYIAGETTSEGYKGFNLGTSVNVETLKFIQFNLGLSQVNLSKSGAELIGSRVSVGMKLVFTAPLLNLELGGGYAGSSLKYYNEAERDFYETNGSYFSISMNRFISSSFSYVITASSVNRGSSEESVLVGDSVLVSIGLRIWM